MLDTVPHRELSLLRSVMWAEETEIAPAATYIRDAQLITRSYPAEVRSSRRDAAVPVFTAAPRSRLAGLRGYHPVNPRERPIRRGERQRERRVVRVSSR